MKLPIDECSELNACKKSIIVDINVIPTNKIELGSTLVLDKSMALDVVFYDDFEYEGDPSGSGWQFTDWGDNNGKTGVEKTAAFNDSTGGCWISCTRSSDAVNLVYDTRIDYGTNLDFDFWIRMVEGKTTVRIGLQDDQGRELYLDYNHGDYVGWEGGDLAIFDRWNLEGEDLEKKWFHVVRNLTSDVQYALFRSGTPYTSYSPSRVITIEIFQDHFGTNTVYLDNIRLSHDISFNYKNTFAPWTETVFSFEENPTLDLTTPGFTIIPFIIGITLLNYFLRKRSHDRILSKQNRYN
jgi:hypothetical protein